ncbi:hypothetical protein C723_0065 [Christiangramia flava JLT2011]|uniref:Uncharacterized protein n=1 Tax=Christiangramia flava JLT2011 TaxID=1229726 RepID=A0A1L7I4L2_9FLAO|nr:hypothetical protein GRFL_1833 [Christiangramia flava JLT2011]OSS40656.1 hypothetical protein C723_0065 [Christiangramia flava JLT2011]
MDFFQLRKNHLLSSNDFLRKAIFVTFRTSSNYYLKELPKNKPGYLFLPVLQNFKK